jgi:hypothetical protein
MPNATAAHGSGGYVARLITDTMNPPLSLDSPAFYRITLQGLLDPSWAYELGHLRVQHRIQGANPPTTTITGEVADQAALAGVLSLVYSLGYPLISVTYLGEAE